MARSSCAVEISKAARIWSYMLMFEMKMPASSSAVKTVFGRFDTLMLNRFVCHSSNSQWRQQDSRRLHGSNLPQFLINWNHAPSSKYAMLRHLYLARNQCLKPIFTHR